jgi:hypothetical protein
LNEPQTRGNSSNGGVVQALGTKPPLFLQNHMTNQRRTFTGMFLRRNITPNQAGNNADKYTAGRGRVCEKDMQNEANSVMASK